MQFAWDEEILQGNSFRRHLYEHPNIQNLNYSFKKAKQANSKFGDMKINIEDLKI